MSAFPILPSAETEAALNRSGLALLDFWQASCAPCRALEPRLEQFAERHRGEFIGYRVDVDADTSTPGQFGVQTIPTLVLLRDGREHARLDGLIRDADLERALQESHESSR